MITCWFLCPSLLRIAFRYSLPLPRTHPKIVNDRVTKIDWQRASAVPVLSLVDLLVDFNIGSPIRTNQQFTGGSFDLSVLRRAKKVHFVLTEIPALCFVAKLHDNYLAWVNLHVHLAWSALFFSNEHFLRDIYVNVRMPD